MKIRKERIEEEKKPRPSKILIKFCGDVLDYKNISRIESFEEYDEKAEHGLKYGIKVWFQFGFPNQKSFFFNKEETRNIKLKILQNKMKKVNAYII